MYFVTGIYCPFPDEVLHGRKDHIKDRALHFGDIVNYTCKPGYMLVGASMRVCTGDTTWSGESPTCACK